MFGIPIPAWMISFLIQAAVKFGLAWAIKQFPGLPAEVIKIIEDFLEEIKKPHVSNSSAKKTAIAKIKDCYGVGCPTETKGI